MDSAENGWVRSGQATAILSGVAGNPGDVSAAVVKRAYRYRFHPSEEQAVELSRTSGCVRLVYNRGKK